MNCCKLFETISKSGTSLDEEHNPKSYNCTESCPFYGKCFYTVECPPKDPTLQEYFCGWQKYAVYQINDKKCLLDYNGCNVINILHLINPMKAGDIIIFRIAKKNKNDNGFSIRYVCGQSSKVQFCSNLNELNNHLDKKCQYVGRKLEVIKDFKNV